jgi:hypothetical protein
VAPGARLVVVKVDGAGLYGCSSDVIADRA